MSVTPELHPLVSVSANPGTVVNAGTSVTFSATAVGAGPGPKYQWYRNNSLISGATQTTFTTNLLSDRDSVSCLVTATNECASYTGSGAKTMTVVAPNSVVTAPERTSHVSIVPNPNSGSFSLSGLPASRGFLIVTDAVGKQVYSNAFDGQSAKEMITLSNELPGGIYLLIIRCEQTTESLKFSVVK